MCKLRACFVLTGDTLYSTNGELIDWYVGGSSVNQMAESVRLLQDLILTKQVLRLLILKTGNNKTCILTFLY